MNDRARELGSRIRTAYEARREELLQIPGVSGVGIGWRDGHLRFIIEAESFDQAKVLRASLPQQVDDFPIFVEVAGATVAAEQQTPPRDRRPKRHSVIGRLLAAFTSERKGNLLFERRQSQPSHA